MNRTLKTKQFLRCIHYKQTNKKEPYERLVVVIFVSLTYPLVRQKDNDNKPCLAAASVFLLGR